MIFATDWSINNKNKTRLFRCVTVKILKRQQNNFHPHHSYIYFLPRKCKIIDSLSSYIYIFIRQIKCHGAGSDAQIAFSGEKSVIFQWVDISQISNTKRALLVPVT